MSAAPRKQRINIKAFKPAAQIDANYADTLWQVLATAFQQIYHKNASNLSFEELYRNAYNMVLYKHGERLYNGVKEVISERLKDQARIVSETAEDEQFLTELRRKWEDHCIFMTMFRDILMYMDRTYVPQHKVPSVYDLGLILFREHVARHDRVRNRLRKIILGTVQRERAGEAIDKLAIREVTKMLLELGVNSRSVYEDDFEKHFLDESTLFYKRESGHYISSNTCSEYLQKAARRLEEEVTRVEHYMDAATENKIREVVEREMLSAHMQTLLHMESSGLVWMLRNDQIQDLQRMYSLFRRVPRGLQEIRATMCSDLEDTGTAFVNDQERCKQPEQFVQGLLDMKRKYDVIWKTAFKEDTSMRKGVEETFTKFLNKNKHSPEFLSLYIDEVLRKGVKGISDEEMDKLLDDILTLFQFLEDKDVFERYYKTHLAKRLLLGRSASDDAERSMISKLKVECGYQFTNKLEGMFNDIKLSSETMENFKKFVAQRKLTLHGVDLSVKVLTTGYWPSQAITACTFPPDIADCCKSFKDFYLSTHSGRTLTWQTNMGSADVKGNFKKKRCELNVSTFQMIILMLFNKNDSLTVKEIRDTTGIPDPELTRHLLSLCSPKLPILQKLGSRPTDDCVISYNMDFQVKLFRVKVPLLREERDLQAPPVPADVLNDRRMVIDAAIVRIMKARKRLEHANLVAEVFKQLQSRFHPEPIDIKRRIENLIEREYLERAQDDRRVYQYLA
eukprot:TRINITY_DN12798_c0_g1_i1.p1 TRINITY_DN12798_c0_g1~~TRINITY_DN12798_c0_g1_i1.p1  ORF type:complete len:751 (-),score=174.57 TRINITY_DN12798_c0_g1_i1:20-2224(-)